MSADIVKPKEELSPTAQPQARRFNWQTVSQWGCIGGALVIVLPLLLCAGVAGWLYFTTPTTSAAAPRRPAPSIAVQCIAQGYRYGRIVDQDGNFVSYYCDRSQGGPAK